MDMQLQERLRIFEQEDLASSAIVAFVRETLLWLEVESGYACTEESAGTLASHLMLALARIERGEELGSTWGQDVHEEAQQMAPIFSWAEELRMRALQQLSLTLPAEEMDFLMLHLGAFLLRNNDPRLAHLDA